MRRKAPEGKGKTLSRTGDVRSDFTKEQLAGIGAAALVFNTLEDHLESLFASATQIPSWLTAQVSSRINGLEGTVAIIRAALAEAKMVFPGDNQIADDMDSLGSALDKFLEFKGIRDTLIHARVINAAAAIARGANRRGSKPWEVWLSVAALEAYYRHSTALIKVLEEGAKLLAAVTALQSFGISEPDKSKLESLVQSKSTQFRHEVQVLQSLLPMPEFPDEHEIQEAVDRWRVAQQAELADWMRPFQQQPSRAAFHIRSKVTVNAVAKSPSAPKKPSKQD